MFAEYVPFTIKYFYHILVIVVSFVLFGKFFVRSAKGTARSGTHPFTTFDESADSSESNIAADTSETSGKASSVIFVSF